MRAFIGLGSNLDDPPAQLREALHRLQQQSGVKLLKQSSVYRSAPLGAMDQPDYCNAVAEIETTLPALDLLKVLLGIEQAMGRQRSGARWQPRRIDLDLLLYGDEQIDVEGLCVPHPEMRKRDFVLKPLAEIAPDVVIPGYGTVRSLAEKMPSIAIVAP